MPLVLLAAFLLRLFTLPLFRIALFFVRPLKARHDFETRNFYDDLCQSFSKDDQQADLLIHFSSEGEFEQVKPIINEALKNNKKIELIFTSPSVEKKVVALAYENDSIRFLRLPVLQFLSQNINYWVTAKQMIMVRYDFFPELLMLGQKMEKFILLLASSKSSSSNPISRFIKSLIYNQFTHIYPTTQSDKNFFESSTQAQVYDILDLRPMQIQKRQDEYKNKHWDVLNNYSHGKKVVFAQLWPSEIDIFDNSNLREKILSRQISLVVCPHKFDEEFVANIETGIKRYLKDIPIYHIQNAKDNFALSSFQKSPGVIFSTIPGELCEIFPYFDSAFVGGGHGKGVHSLFEPFMGGCQIICGPNVLRSTEYDQIISMGGEVEVVNDLKRVVDKLEEVRDNNFNVKDFLENSHKRFLDLLKLLGIVNA